MTATYELSCDCGSTKMTATGAPMRSVYCHCRDCRALYAVTINAITAWAKDSVVLPNPQKLAIYKTPGREMIRHSCPDCGTLMYGLHKGKVPMIPHSLFRQINGGELPPELAPTLHVSYRERVIDIDDELVKSQGRELLAR